MRPLPSPRTNRRLAIRDQQGLGYLPDGTARFSRNGEPLRHFMGHLDVRRVHGDAGDRAREGESRGAAPRLRPVRLRALRGNRGRSLHGSGAAWINVRRLRLRSRRARRRDRLPPCGRRPHHRFDLSEERLGQAAATARPIPDSLRRTRSSGFARRRAASAPTTPSKRRATSRSWARRSRPRGKPGGSRR